MAGPMSTTDVASGESDPGVDRHAAQLRTYFLERLHRLMALGAVGQLAPAQRRLVNHALYSTYWDCASLGSPSEAGGIIGLPPQLPRRQARGAVHGTGGSP